MPHLWPIPVPGRAGLVLAMAGLGLMFSSMAALWLTGKGLPMNAYPPSRFVRSGPYSIVRHPIYFSFVAVVAGIAVAANSPAGFWIITPISALSVIGLVLGYEGPGLRARFGDALGHVPLLGPPPPGRTHAPLAMRLSAAAIVFGPWAILYVVLSMVPAPIDALDLRLDWERNIALQGWAVWLYSAAYPVAIAGPLVLSTTGNLRRFVISGWFVTLLGFATMLLLPGRAELLPVRGSEIEVFLMQANRSLDADWLALPSFHIAWVVLAAYCFAAARPGLRPLAMLSVGLVGLSCVLTGSHAVVDVVAGLALGMFGWHHGQVWHALVAWSERLANSWNAVELGPVRVISHAIWSGLGVWAAEGWKNADR
ncbi:MAG: phosphatase PAP2 family protein [Rhodocyclales bacterium]|nr:phosphatase PAP2 family protein [Rhodocyclales bacterium]